MPRDTVHSSPSSQAFRLDRMIARVFFGSLLLCCALAASAADNDWRFEVTPYGGYRFGGEFEIDEASASYDVADSASFGLILNLRHQANTQWELLYSNQSTDATIDSGVAVQPTVDLDIYVLQIGGTYQGEGDKVRPYLAATIGGTRIETNADSDTFFSGSIGVGLQISPHSRIGLRLEARAYGTLTDSDTDLFCRTGPDLNLCAIRVDGNLLGQFETLAGIVIRF